MIGDRECIDVSIKSVKELESMREFLRDPSRIAVIDVETTGLNPKNDEILQVAICDGNCTELFNSYVMPERRKRWPSAQKVNGITWEMVKDSPTLNEVSAQIHTILNSKELVIGYNLRFDFSMLEAGGVDTQVDGITWDIMNDCSIMMDNWNGSKGEYSFVRLQTIAERYDIQYAPHDALEDSKATLMVFERLINDPEYRNKVEQKEKWIEEATERENKRLQEEDMQHQIQEKKLKTGFILSILIIVLIIAAFLMSTCRTT